jgi:hypothetical protein
MMLLINAYQGIYLAPNLALPSESLETVGAVAQVAVGILLCAQISFSFSGVLVLIVTGLTAFVVPFEVLVDYLFEFVALSLSMILIGPSLSRIDRRFFPYIRRDPERFARLALPVIRIGVGLTLVILSLHNKLLNPGLGLAFLDEFHFNFMPLLGFEGFTDLRFVFAAGVGELTIGLLILGGVATRFVTFVLTAFFATTMIVLGPIELIGHAPLIGIAVLLMLTGAGPYRITRTDYL